MTVVDITVSRHSADNLTLFVCPYWKLLTSQYFQFPLTEWRAVTWKCYIIPSQTSISCICTNLASFLWNLPLVANGSFLPAKTIFSTPGGLLMAPASFRWLGSRFKLGSYVAYCCCVAYCRLVVCHVAYCYVAYCCCVFLSCWMLWCCAQLLCFVLCVFDWSCTLSPCVLLCRVNHVKSLIKL